MGFPLVNVPAVSQSVSFDAMKKLSFMNLIVVLKESTTEQ